MKVCVTVVRYGFLFVEADNVAEAFEIANRQAADAVNWSDDWECTDAVPDDSIPDCQCVTEEGEE